MTIQPEQKTSGAAMLKNGINNLSLWFKKLNTNEKRLVVLAAVIGITFFANHIYSWADNCFALQRINLEKVERDRLSVTEQLKRYTELKLKREKIEAQYKQVEIKEGVLRHLEMLVRDKAGVGSGQYDIKEREASKFGGQFEQVPFTVKFSSTAYANLVSFLDELVHGSRPLILSGLELKKRAPDRLEVSIDVSTIRQAQTR